MQKDNFLVKNVIPSMNEISKGTILRSMAIFTAIELGGSFLRGKTGKNTTKPNFLIFCRSPYMTRYENYAKLLYEIFRNGVAHSYLAKGGALLSSEPKDKDMHLEYFDDGLFIYVPQFASDVTKAIQDFCNDLKYTKDLKDKYESVLSKLHTDGMQAYNTYIKNNNITTRPCAIKGDIRTII